MFRGMGKGAGVSVFFSWDCAIGGDGGGRGVGWILAVFVLAVGLGARLSLLGVLRFSDIC